MNNNYVSYKDATISIPIEIKEYSKDDLDELIEIKKEYLKCMIWFKKNYINCFHTIRENLSMIRTKSYEYLLFRHLHNIYTVMNKKRISEYEFMQKSYYEIYSSIDRVLGVCNYDYRKKLIELMNIKHLSNTEKNYSYDFVCYDFFDNETHLKIKL